MSSSDAIADGRRQRPPFAMVPEALLRDAVSDRAVRLYGLLDRYLGDHAKAWPARGTMADALECSTDSIDRAIAELEAAGWLIRESGQAAGITNRYRLLDRPRPQAVETGPVAVDNDARPRRTTAAPPPHGSGTPAAPVRHKREALTRDTTESTAGSASSGGGRGLLERNARRAAGDACPECNDTTKVLDADDVARPCPSCQ